MTKNPVIHLQKIPPCDLCSKPATYDAKTLNGSWAYLCNRCFKVHGVGLGLGKEQIIIQKKVNDDKTHLECVECSHKFSTMNIYNVECPKCGAFSLETITR